MDGLKMVFESLGSLIAYRFSLLPRWARACCWAFIMGSVLMGALAGIGFAAYWTIKTFGEEAIAVFAIIVVVFCVSLTTVRDDIPDGKRKNDE
jgi:hypothetical protein